ncbi:MAG: hypothetical protein NVS4B11_12750 [Ktedonobacteraceae bacterium]
MKLPVVVSFISLHVSQDEGEIRAYCRGAISTRKIPRYIRFVTAYPATASGKIKKFEFRVQFIKELGLEG